MILWQIQFQIFKPIQTFPKPGIIASEKVSGVSYHHEGQFRKNEIHCLFKYTLAGEGIFRDADGEHRIPAGSGFLCEIRDPATAYYYPPDGKEPWSFVYCTFTGPSATEMTREMTQRHGPVYTLPKEYGIVQRLMTYQNSDDATMQITPGDGARLIMELFSTLADSKDCSRQENTQKNLAERAMKTIHSHLDRNINVSDLAGILDVSREHLTRVFKEQTTVTPLQYLLRQKMLLACRLLKETALTNKQIAMRLGYDEPVSFVRTFRNVIKMPPGQFRAVGTIPFQ
ncbi:MAG: AraC family transcriptional regulator [Phycisphaerae bacterium]|nr:AraC family transcriptional regulator [Phycisphaerae bacterium]